MKKSIQEKFDFLEKHLKDKFKDSIIKVSKHDISNFFELKENIREIAVKEWTDGEEFANIIIEVKNICPNSKMELKHGVFDEYNERLEKYKDVYCIVIIVQLDELDEVYE